MQHAFAQWIERHQKWFGIPLVLLMSLTAFSIAVIRPGYIEEIELKSLDQRFKIRGPIQPDERLAIVTVDDNSLTEIGRWPWSRDKIATLIDLILGQYGAGTVGLDIVFSEAQANPLDETLRLLKRANLDHREVSRWLRTHRSLGDLDAELQQVFAKYHDRLVPGYFFYPEGAVPPELAIGRLDKLARQMQPSAMTAEFADDALHSLPVIAAVEGNLERLTRAADAVGFFNFFPDSDGMVRRIPLVAELDGFVYPALALQTLRTFLGWPAMDIRVGVAGVEELKLGDHLIRTDHTGSMLINHYGPGQTFPHISAADILKGRVDADRLRGKLVLLGVTAVGVFDYRPSPFDSVFPGVEGHAAAIANILNDAEISRPGYLDFVELVSVLLLALLAGFTVQRRGPVVQSLVMIGVPLLLVVVALWLFGSYGVWLKVAYPILGVLLATLPVTLIEYYIESRRRAFIHDAFAHYLSPKVVEGLARNPESLKLGGAERNITALFSDIAGFSAFAERLTPEELVHFLNIYLTEMSNIILDLGGTIDKYEGDAIIAFFGAPLEMADHASRAVTVALRQQQALARLRPAWLEQGFPEIHTRIGINSGPAVIGNMGSENRMNYTMMGDHVNLASRLEGACKVYRVPILISRDSYLAVRDTVAARFVDRVRVVGRSQPVELYEPLGLRSEVDSEAVALGRAYEQAWSRMRECDFAEAERQLAELHARAPDDGLFEVMLQRAKEYVAKPPPAKWDGIHNLTGK